MRLLLRANLQYLARHPWQLALAMLGIVLGVAIIVAVQATQTSSRAAFTTAQEWLRGPATHRIQARDGLFDERVYAELIRAFPDLAATPVLDQGTLLAAPVARWARIVGVDILSPLQPLATGPVGARAASLLAPNPAQGLASPETVAALRDGAQVGSSSARLRAQSTGLALEVEATGVPLPTDVVLVDIATAQEFLHLPGRISRIELRLPPRTERAGRAAAIGAHLPAGLELVDNRQEVAQQLALTHAFDTNVTALSLLSLVVGMFLIYNTETFLVVQRLPVFARLRALGVSTPELVISLLVEALAIGLAASLAGCVAGYALARILQQLVTRTVSDLYFAVAAVAPQVPPARLAGIVVLGSVATALAALPAIWEVRRRPVARGLQPTGAGPQRRLYLGSLLCWATATIAVKQPTPTLWGDFAALFVYLAGAALLVPAFLGFVARRLAAASTLRHRASVAIGVGSLLRYGRRTGPAAAALTIAAAVSLGMQLMTASFRTAVDSWLSNLLRADLYVSVADGAPPPLATATLDALRQKLATDPGISALSSVLRTHARSATGEVALTVYDLPRAGQRGFRFLAGDPVAVWLGWRTQDEVIVSEPYAYRHRLRVGDSMLLAAPDGDVAFRIAGLYRDYASERGTVAMSRDTYTRHWPASGYSGLGVYLRNPATGGEIRQRIHRLAEGGLPLNVLGSAELHSQSLRVFDRTFAITRLLGALAFAVAIIGIIGALLAQQLELVRDYGILRALGLTPKELAGVVLTQTIVIGFVATAAALPLGVAVCAFLVYIVNLHSFGWTMAMAVTPGQLAIAAAQVLAAAFVSGLYPILRASRIPPARALRHE